MVLVQLRVKETPKQLTLFGCFFLQYFPVRERRTTPEFCVTWVPKVRAFGTIPDAAKAAPGLPHSGKYSDPWAPFSTETLIALEL